MSVPIEDIVKNKMELDLIMDRHLTKDFSVLGQIYFSNAEVEVYKEDGDIEKLDVKRGTIFIDPKTLSERNRGCLNFTIAHEAYHWYGQRVFAAIKSIVHKEKVIAHRCPRESSNQDFKKGKITDENSMEWVANNMAPRILMPTQTVKPLIERLMQEFNYHDNDDYTKAIILDMIAENIAEIYEVSKQAAKIRIENFYPSNVVVNQS